MEPRRYRAGYFRLDFAYFQAQTWPEIEDSGRILKSFRALLAQPSSSAMGLAKRVAVSGWTQTAGESRGGCFGLANDLLSMFAVVSNVR